MATLEEDMLAQAAPQQAVPQEMAGAQSPVNLRDALSPLASDPAEQFLVAMMGVADDLGLTDEIQMGEETIEDQADLQDVGADPMQFLSEQQLIELVTKFEAIPEEQRGQMEKMLREELPPQVAQRLDAVVRFVRQRTNQGAQ